MRTWVLGSGSRGNAVLVDCGESRVLIDAGFPVRTLAARLERAGVPPEAIEAVVITHEHSDHVRGAGAAATKWGWTIHATAGTVAACPELSEGNVQTFETGGTITLSHMEIRSVRVPHDASEPVAFVATATRTGARVGIAYDLGSASPSLCQALREVDVLVLEANHDDELLRAGPYPLSVRERIAGRHGHLSNRAAARLARECVHAGLAHVVLAHLSERCNDPVLAHAAVTGALAGARRRLPVHVAMQDAVTGPFEPGLRQRSASVQMELF
ncbi:MAG: MBL fold metallo-hydrolase [Gemmatimonadota bacterium]|nr:MBL fold metallo-hydrolase [Gemmatimonadota bacterium]